jgi:uncharacterized protein (DUF427 family)
VRAERGGEVVVDSRRAVLVWPPGRPVPSYAFPAEDVRHPGAAALDDPDLAGMVTVPWGAVDRWLEEDEEVFVHPRDPYARVDVLPSSRHVQVRVDGELVAESRRSAALFETGLRTRWYLPREDVRDEALRPSATHTQCPYKGTASYWTVVTAAGEHPDLAWCYPDPLPAVQAIRGRVCFYDERVELLVDGEPAG